MTLDPNKFDFDPNEIMGDSRTYIRGFNKGLELAALYMLNRKVSASEFYAKELREMKVEEK